VGDDPERGEEEHEEEDHGGEDADGVNLEVRGLGGGHHASPFGVLVGGAVVTEKLFRWPGIGQLSVDAVFDRDAPVVLGVVILTSSAIVLANLFVDLSYALLDPRVRQSSR